MAAHEGRQGCSAAILGIGAALVIAGSVACGQPVEKASVDETGTLTATAATSTAQSEAVPTAEATVGATPIVATPVTTFDGTFMIVGGEAWVDAEPSSEEVRALIGEVECAVGSPGLLHDASRPRWMLIVPPASERAGCGTPGAIIRFEIGGRAARQSVAWTQGWGVGLTLSIGPEAAVYGGRFRLDELPIGVGVEPLIDGRVCGRRWIGFRGLGPEWGYEVIVYPEEIAPGCGRAGARVTLQIVAVDEETGARTIVGELAGINAEWAPGETTGLGVADVVATP